VGGSLPHQSALRESSISSGKIGCIIIFMWGIRMCKSTKQEKRDRKTFKKTVI
jgi:hypothetical protein